MPNLQNQNQKPKKHPFKVVVMIFLVSVLIILGFSAGYMFGLEGYTKNISTKQLLTQYPNVSELDVDFNLFFDTWSHIKQNYVKEDISDQDLFYGALEGLVSSLGDPYSVFLEPEVAAKFDEELSGSFEGIGAEIGIRKDQLTIIAPLSDTPADRAGLKAGDSVIAIDGESTFNITLDEAINKIRGPKGEEVILKIFRDEVDEPFDISIVRDKIDVVSVEWEQKENRLAYIEVKYFNGDTLDEFNKVINEVIQYNPNGIILDLRNNPGGFLGTAIEVAGAWVEDDVVVFEKKRDGYQEGHRPRGSAPFKNIPTVVLVNIGSASGSEIVAGALQDYQLAQLVGEQTFGKGSVQDLRKLDDGSSIKLTIAEWLTPSGSNINEEGIVPDVEVKLTREDFENGVDTQMDKAIEILTE
ncbi:S41 family peptidase [Patescibacteria group bacterium]|nr:S41 family peptidase [Patescibacteria group bacterium]